MRNGSSSTIPSQIPSSSTVPVSEAIAYIQQYSQQEKQLTPAQIRAQGEVKTRIGVLWLVGIICTILGIFGGISFIVSPQNAKDVWVIIGPILSSAITGTIAFLTGEKQGTKN